MPLRTHHKLFLSYSLLVAAVVVVLTLGVDAALRRPLMDRAAADLLRELALGRELYDGAPSVSPDSLARHIARVTGHRVTVIARDGTVVGESEVSPDALGALAPHAARPEFRAALERGTGTAVRRSASVNQNLLYAAGITRRGEVLRFAVGIEQIDDAVSAMRRQIAQVGFAALLLAAAFSFAFSIAVTRPLRRMRDTAAAMASGDLGARVRTSRRDELGALGEALDTLADELQGRLGQLEGEREEMKALIDAMAEGVLAVDPDGTVRRANPAAREMFGLGGDPAGAPSESVDRRRPFLALVRSALAGEPVSATELGHGGRSLLATAQPLPRGGAVLVFLDVSELRRLEEVRREFVANASHELKTPLTAIRGYAETLLDDALPPEVRRRFTATLHANAARLQKILDDLLDLSRIESGGWKIEARAVRVEETARRAWQPFAQAAAERGVAFATEIHPAAAALEADPAALEQVFSNLFSNALRYTPSGGRVEVRAAPAAGGAVRIEVADSGSGIPAAHLGRIFERFYRVDPARSRAEGGTGLGLAIVRHLVERHGGRVEARSEVGRGTTIRLILPIRPPSGTAAAD